MRIDEFLKLHAGDLVVRDGDSYVELLPVTATRGSGGVLCYGRFYDYMDLRVATPADKEAYRQREKEHWAAIQRVRDEVAEVVTPLFGEQQLFAGAMDHRSPEEVASCMWATPVVGVSLQRLAYVGKEIRRLRDEVKSLKGEADGR